MKKTSKFQLNLPALNYLQGPRKVFFDNIFGIGQGPSNAGKLNWNLLVFLFILGQLYGDTMDYRHPERKKPSLHGRNLNPNPKFLGMAAAYFDCHIGPIFQISLIYALIGCP
jgi:hypothetical protein